MLHPRARQKDKFLLYYNMSPGPKQHTATITEFHIKLLQVMINEISTSISSREKERSARKNLNPQLSPVRLLNYYDLHLEKLQVLHTPGTRKTSEKDPYMI